MCVCVYVCVCVCTYVCVRVCVCVCARLAHKMYTSDVQLVNFVPGTRLRCFPVCIWARSCSSAYTTNSAGSLLVKYLVRSEAAPLYPLIIRDTINLRFLLLSLPK